MELSILEAIRDPLARERIEVLFNLLGMRWIAKRRFCGILGYVNSLM